MGFDHIDLLVLVFSEVGVDDDGSVMAGVDFGRVVAVLFQGADDAIELPGGGGTCRVEEMPTYIDFQGGFRVFADGLLVTRQVHEPVVIAEYGSGGGAKDCNFGCVHAITIAKEVVKDKSGCRFRKKVRWFLLFCEDHTLRGGLHSGGYQNHAETFCRGGYGCPILRYGCLWESSGC